MRYIIQTPLNTAKKTILLLFLCIGIQGFLRANNDQSFLLGLPKGIVSQEVVKHLVQSTDSSEEAAKNIRSLTATCRGMKDLLLKDKKRVINHLLQKFPLTPTQAQEKLFEITQSGKGTGLEMAILKQASADLDALSNSGDVHDPPLIMAARNGHPAIVALLLSTGANKDIQNKLKDTALTVAIMKNHKEVATLLINAGANVRLTNNLGSHALGLAAERDQAPLVGLLLNNGADVNQINAENGYTALMVAIISSKKETVNLLLNAPTIDVNKKNEINGYTPLILASILSKEEMVELLLKAGADALPRDNEGKTALDHAQNSLTGNSLIIELLQEAEQKSPQNQ